MVRETQVSSHSAAACESLLISLEHATSRLLDLNPADLSTVQAALAARTIAIESLLAWVTASEARAHLGAEFTARLEGSLAAGTAVALRLTLVRLGVGAQLAGLAREKFLLDALADTGARAASRSLDYSG